MKYEFDVNASFEKLMKSIFEQHIDESEDDAIANVMGTLAEDILPVLFSTELMKGIDASIKEVNEKLANTDAEYKVQLNSEDVYGALIYLISKRYGKLDEEDMDNGFIETDPA